MSQSQFSLVGNTTIKRRDIIPRITGARRYSSDISATDIGAGSMVYMGLVTCPYPSAKILSIDVSKAEAAGFATLTGADLPAYNYAGNSRPYLPLALDKVIYSGQAVAAVASTDPDTVTDGIELVNATYQAQPYVFDAEEALQPGAPQIWEGGNSIIGPAPMVNANFGDVATALSQADEVVSQRYDTPVYTHFETEPCSLVAWYTGGMLYTWEKSSYVFGDQAGLASYFGMPVADVVCRDALGGTTNAAAGGIFGNSTPEASLVTAAKMSMKVGAPVKYVPTRLEQARTTTNRFPVRGYVSFGGTKAGALTAIQATLYFDFGAGGGAFIDGPDDFYNLYVAPNVHVESYATNTNRYGVGAAQRDVGESQCHFMVESTIDMLAEKLGIDPVTFRLNNMRAVGPNAIDPVTTLPYAEMGQPAVFNAAISAFNWSSLWKGWGVPVAVNGTKRIGVGIGLENGNKGAAFPPSSGQIQVNPDGTVTVFSGHHDHGAGTSTTIPIMAAQLIGLSSLDNVTYVCADTSMNTDSSVTAGSQGTRNAGYAMVAAATDLASQWFPIVAAHLAAGTKASNLAFGGGLGANLSGLGGNVSTQPSGIIYDTTNPSNQMTFAAAAALLTAPITGNGVGTPLMDFTQTHRVQGTKLVQLQVDTETGQVDILNYIGALDLGRRIFPTGADHQSQGGFVGLGVGMTLYEETVNDPSTGLNLSGSYINPTFLDFKIPSFAQVPNTATPLWIEGVDPSGPFGAKGIGELCLISSSAAISNALSNALGGYRFTKLPIRREDIVAALQWMQSQGML